MSDALTERMIVGDMIFFFFFQFFLTDVRQCAKKVLSWLETNQLTPKLYELEKICN